MQDFLSDIETNSHKKNNLFSKLAFGFAMLSTIFVLALLITIASKTFNRHAIVFSRTYVRITDICILIGAMLSIISIVKKEKLKYYKVIGIIINFTLFTIIAVGTVLVIMMKYRG